MPRYEHDPANVTTSITIFPKGEYEFEIGKPKAFERTAKAGHQSYGVRFPLLCTQVLDGDENMLGKKTMQTVYLHSDGAQQMGKRFQMAVAGFTVNEANEKQYNEAAAGKDWSYDTDSGEVGAAWLEYEGQRVVVDLDVQIQKNEKDEEVQSQQYGTWRPLQAA